MHRTPLQRLWLGPVRGVIQKAVHHAATHAAQLVAAGIAGGAGDRVTRPAAPDRRRAVDDYFEAVAAAGKGAMGAAPLWRPHATLADAAGATTKGYDCSAVHHNDAVWGVLRF